MARRTSTTRSTPGWLKLFSFIAVMLLGLALALSVLLGYLVPEIKAISNWIERIAIGIALLIPLFLSYYEARYNKSQVWFILWIIAVILIVVFYILAIVL